MAKHPLKLIISWPNLTITHNGRRGYPRPASTYRAARRNAHFRPKRGAKP